MTNTKTNATKTLVPDFYLQLVSDGGNAPRLKWESVSGASSYILYRAPASTGEYVTVVSGNITTYLDGGPTQDTSGKRYLYKACATDSASLVIAESQVLNVIYYEV